MWNTRKSKFFAFVLLVALWSSNGIAQDVPTDNDSKIQPENFDVDIIPPTTKIVPPQTTTPSTTTSTTPPSTTSTPPPTTPSTTTTTTTTPPPTTIAPTTAKPTTPPKPTPVPKPSIGKWNTSCIMVQMAAQVNLTYETKDKKNATALYNLPSGASVKDSPCLEQTDQIVLEWGPSTGINSLHLQFDKNDTKKEFSLTTVQFKIQIEGDEFPNAAANQTVQLLHYGPMFSTPLKMSYHCTREQDVNLTETIANEETIGTVTLTNVQFEAFRSENSTKFSTAKDCDAMDTPDVVPIAVGIALATLILIVLIAYLIARRRSTARGYTSF